jgi:basic membrane protein A
VFLAVAIVAVPADAGGQLRIGLVLEQPLVGRAGDPFQYGAYRGLRRAVRELHVGAKAVAPSPTGTGDAYLAPFSYLARQRYDLVIGVGFLEADSLSKVARRFPHVKFGLLDAPRNAVKPPRANVEGTVFHTEQAAYLAGFVAARMADQGPPPHVVSSVGGIPIPTVQSYIAGFQAGAKRADPKIRLLNAYSYDFLNPTKCKHAALDQIAHGSRVVFDVAGACGIGALEAARRKGVYGIGVDIDQSYLGKFILTSVVKNLSVAVYDFAKLLVDGRLRTGGNLTFDLRNHGVGLGKFGPHVSLALRDELLPLAARIEQGKIVVPATLSRSH